MYNALIILFNGVVMDNRQIRSLTAEEIERLKQFGKENPNATRRDFAAAIGLNYNTFLRCLAEKRLRFQTLLVEADETGGLPA